MTEKVMNDHSPNLAISINRLALGFSRHGLLIVNIILGVWLFLPWLAPVLMVVGLEGGGNLIYKFYSFQCHQLPQRSYFLFGPQTMVPMADIYAVWPYLDQFQLRQFVGTPELGYKVAWSDRMVSLYMPLLVGGLLFALARWWRGRTSGEARGWRPLPFRWWLVALVPLGLDGFSHMISDVISFWNGFRYTNAWLAELTNNAFAPTFYAGDALGSFNWWMRLLTGLLAGAATAWAIYPYLEEAFADMRKSMEKKLSQ